MTPALLAALLALAAQQPAYQPAHQPEAAGRRPWRDACPRELVGSFNELEQSMKALADDIDGLDSKRERRALRDGLDKAIRASERAREDACDAARSKTPVVVVQPPPPPPPPPRQPLVLSSAGFEEVKKAVRQESFDDGRESVVKLAITGETCVTVDQARTLIATQTFSDAKLTMARHLVPRIVDRDRAFTLTQGMTFPSDREAISGVISSSPQLEVCRVPRP